MKEIDDSFFHVPNEYELYLESEQFGNIRESVFSRDGHKCKVCGSNENIVPHHLTYRNIYHEEIRDLVTLCKRCHSIYHSIQKRADTIENYYAEIDRRASEEEALKNQSHTEESRKRWEISEESCKRIYEDIVQEYTPRDYAKNGDLDMCNWDVLNKAISDKVNSGNYEYANEWGVGKQRLMNYFLYRRYEFLLRCIDKGFTRDQVVKKTMFEYSWVSKWYDKAKLEKKLAGEKFINGGNN